MVSWIIERDVFSEDCFNRMIETFKTNYIPYQVVTIIPFSHELVEKKIKVPNPCVIYGSIGSQSLATRFNLTPGVWTGPEFNYSEYVKHIPDYILNPDAKVLKMSEVSVYVQNMDNYFIKPNGDLKEFAGQVLVFGEFDFWYDKLISIGYLDHNDFDVVVSATKVIGNEWRLVVVDKQIVAASLYKQYGRSVQKDELPFAVGTFATEIIARYNPAPVYVMDICETTNGLKVIEYNTFNHAGLYACDVSNIILAINSYIKK